MFSGGTQVHVSSSARQAGKKTCVRATERASEDDTYGHLHFFRLCAAVRSADRDRRSATILRILSMLSQALTSTASFHITRAPHSRTAHTSDMNMLRPQPTTLRCSLPRQISHHRAVQVLHRAHQYNSHRTPPETPRSIPSRFWGDVRVLHAS